MSNVLRVVTSSLSEELRRKKYDRNHLKYMEGSVLSFYLDGKDHGYVSDSRFSLLLFNPRLVVTIGGDYFSDTIKIKPTNYESRKCFTENPEFNYTHMYGEIDDFKVYARALTDVGFATLAQS
jgi:hypothetical protein